VNAQFLFQGAHTHLALRELAQQEQAVFIGKHLESGDRLCSGTTQGFGIDDEGSAHHGQSGMVAVDIVY
jgi:hypothetical protein